MLQRLFALVILLVLVGGGLYYWKVEGRGLPAPGSLGEVGDRIEDTAITGAVKGALELNRHLAPYALTVDTEDGVVTLRGRVASREDRERAVAVVAAVPRVRQVVDHLKLEPGTRTAPPSDERSLGETLDDHALEVRVRLAFSLNRGLEGSDLRVSAFRHAVTLSGRARSDSQRTLAVQVARDTSGVSGITDSITVGTELAGRGRVAAERALEANPHLSAYRIRVRETEGRIVLTGRVRTGAEKDLAEVLARDAAGLAVDNRLKVAR